MNEKPSASPGGGPLRGIMDDPTRGEGERAMCLALVRLIKQRQSMHARRLEPLPGVSMSFAQMRLLFHLPIHDQLTVTQFAESADMTAASATQALGALEELHLVTRTRSGTDRRIVDVALTDRGRALLESLRDRFIGRWDELTKDVNEPDFATAARVMEQMLQVFDFDWNSP